MRTVFFIRPDNGAVVMAATVPEGSPLVITVHAEGLFTAGSAGLQRLDFVGPLEISVRDVPEGQA